MHRWPHFVGCSLGLVVAAFVLALADGRQRTPPRSGPLLSECDGRLRELVIHYEPSARDMVAPVYRQFLSLLEADTIVHAVCPDQRAFDDLLTIIGPHRCRLSPILAGHPITTWSRDRWLALGPPQPGGATTLWTPRGEAAESIWAARAGDERVALEIAAALTGKVVARRSALYFDGGDFLADDQAVFVIPRVLRRNLQCTVATRDELTHMLAAEFKRRVVLLEESPDHHAAMFMVSAGTGTMLVGDPSLARAYWTSADARPTAQTGEELWQPDFSPETQRLFDKVAEECTAAGYRVLRIPTLPGTDGKAYLTYVNVLLDCQGGRRIVYLPLYQGVKGLNTAAREVWERLGYEVRPVDCTSTYRHFGCLHCLVNVLRRSGG